MDKMCENEQQIIKDQRHTDYWLEWCRLCAKTQMKNPYRLNWKCSINATDKHNHTLARILTKFFHTKINIEDALPQKICEDCYGVTVAFGNFLTHTKRSEKLFHELLKQNDRSESVGIVEASNVLEHDENNVKQEELPFSEAAEDTAVEHEVVMYATTKNELFTEICHASKELETTKENSAPEICDNTAETRLLEPKLEPLPDPLMLPNLEIKQRALKRSSSAAKLTHTCSLCETAFKSQVSLRIHKSKMHPNGMTRTPLRCTYCSKVLSSRCRLATHLKSHMSQEKRKVIPCPHCSARFCTEYNVREHVQTVHQKERPYGCHICGTRKSTLSHLRQHMLAHTDQRPYQCDMCERNFKTVTYLKRHKQIAHEQQKLVCPECGLQLSSDVTYRNHMRRHSDILQHVCDFCGHGFRHSKTLKDHLLSHTGFKPFACNFCSESYSSVIVVRRHLNKMHALQMSEDSGTKGYTCNKPSLADLKELVRTSAHLLRPSRRGRRPMKAE